MNADLTTSETDALLAQMYSALATGSAFEQFLRVLLSSMGLEEVVVTGKSGDGGIDLTARRKGVEGLSNVDEVAYVVQAKRFVPGTQVPPRDVRALRGVLRSGEVGLFVTTGKFNQREREFAEADESRPLLLVDGRDVVALAVVHDLGFVARPQFSPEKFGQLLGSTGGGGPGPRRLPLATARSSPFQRNAERAGTLVVSRTVSANDIRARILPIPTAIYSHLNPEKPDLLVAFSPSATPAPLAVNHRRKYVAGVTDAYREHGLIGAGGEFVPHEARWSFDPATKAARVEFVPMGDGDRQ